MSIVFIDLEVNQNNKVVDYGAYVDRNVFFHGNKKKFTKFIKGYNYICGHNILMHDLKYIDQEVEKAKITRTIDTLPLSALLFPEKPYHGIVKDYKIDKSLKNDPFIDASKCHGLFYDEINAFENVSLEMKNIYYSLLGGTIEFSAFFEFINYKPTIKNIKNIIMSEFQNEICSNVNLEEIINEYPVELAYCLSIIKVEDKTSIAPRWVINQYVKYHEVLDKLRGISCHECQYCNTHLDSLIALQKYFKYPSYREFDGVKLQEQVVNAQLLGESIVAVFPTAGGKSITFQVPALILGESVKGLTVIISPLQSLMNDQIETLKQHSINNVGTINGSLNTLDRKNTMSRVDSGDINLLYLAPESLRSPSIFKLLAKRNIVRFVIDEAHCFSTWGHDFRVDYQYIGEFIRMINKVSPKDKMIPVSCFTATAKKEVINDIQVYFKKELDIDMNLYKTNTRRKNLSFIVKNCDGHQEKMAVIKTILGDSKDKPVIIYTSRRKSAERVAEELLENGFKTTVYHGGMRIDKKNENQLSFIHGEKKIIVATSAFGMGVDKKDVSYVIHYQVSSTIEDYIQEAGRGGRDEKIDAKCYILYDEKDVDQHFNLLTQTKLSQNDVNSIWKTIKQSTKFRSKFEISATELARRSGWQTDDQITTRVHQCILALENINYIKRHQNSPKIFASSLKPKTMKETSRKINAIPNLTDLDRDKLSVVASTLFTDKTTRSNRGSKPISMIDDLYDQLDLEKKELIRYVDLLKEYEILNLEDDMLVHVPDKGSKKKSLSTIDIYIKMISKLLEKVTEESTEFNLKELNTFFETNNINSSIKNIRTILNFLDDIKILKQKKSSINEYYHAIQLVRTKNEILNFIDQLGGISEFIINHVYKNLENKEEKSVTFSVVEIKKIYNEKSSLLKSSASIEEIEKTLLFIHRIGSLLVDGGFLVLYNPMKIEKIEQNPQKQFSKQDYKQFEEFYKHKVNKIHILIHFVKNLAESEESGLKLVDDYFELDYKQFEKKYITEDYKKYLDKSITKNRYNKLVGNLSEKQKEIIDDNSSNNIVVFAGPGSGKTTLLVKKLASLILLEDVKLSELLMLTFSRSATVVFKQKLYDIIGPQSNYISIKTFYSYCFDIVGEIGDLDKTDEVYEKAIQIIKNNDADEMLLNITTLVIDEAQDMKKEEYDFIQALIDHNEKLRVIAVGDDDQNIYEFRGSDSKYFYELSDNNCNKYELLTNYRSLHNLVEFTQEFAYKINQRYKIGKNTSYTNKDGYIVIYKYITENMYEPLIKSIKSMTNKGTTAVLTYTNEDAELIFSLLLKNNIKAKLIQSNKYFRLDLLNEMDWLIKQFDSSIPYIPFERWQEIRVKFNNFFKKEAIFILLDELLNQYEQLYPEKKYLYDLIQHIKESKLESLYKDEDQIITVSTMHKSKGREFHNVFLMLNKPLSIDKDLRSAYVGLTRAKENIAIFTNQDTFDMMNQISITKKEFTEQYDKPEEIIIQMEHKDISLGISGKIITRYHWKVNAGEILQVNDSGCLIDDKNILYFSNAFKEQLETKKRLGYIPKYAVVEYKVKWFNRDDDKFYWILLPKIYLKFKV